MGEGARSSSSASAPRHIAPEKEAASPPTADSRQPTQRLPPRSRPTPTIKERP